MKKSPPFTIGARVIVTDKSSPHHLEHGHIIAVYDENYFAAGLCIFSKNLYKKIRLRKDQVRIIDGSWPYSSRGDLYRAINSGKIKGEQITAVLRAMRDLGLIEFNIPANIN